MGNKRILVVDDSCLYQRILTDVINARDGLEVVGVASNGKIALDVMEQVKPDLLTLDILMPELDGIQTLLALSKQWPSVKTVMVSSLTSEGSDAALDALALGASEYAVKPSSVGGIDNIRLELTNDLLPKIEALCGVEARSVSTEPALAVADVFRPGPKPQTNTTNAGPPHATGNNINLVAIGVSTGGPDALTKLLSALPASIGVPIVIVQHMPAAFTAKLARRLDAASELSVVEGQQGDKLHAGTAYIAPGDYHMTLEQKGSDVLICLDQKEQENSCRPSVDPLFRSIPAIYGSKCLGVVMTGMGADGLKGCEALATAKCPVIVQDKATSIVWGMPKLVAQAGLAQEQVALDRMAEVVMARVRGASRHKGGGANQSSDHTTISRRCA